ncbi:MAG: SMP-30/gluconolactonase/LRE family protein [Pseudomonadota bacterium]
MTAFRIVDDRFGQMIDQTQGLETLAQGFRFTEGTLWHPTLRHITFSDIPSNRVHRWSVDTGELTTLRDPSDMTNGMVYDREGRLIMCEHATSRVTRCEHDGTITVLADRWQGSELNSPNDIVVDESGAIWFTDPLYGRGDHTGIEREPALPFQGVFRIDPAGSLHLVADDFEGPNGLCFSPDKQKLYINDSEREHIRVFDVATDSALSGGAIFAETSNLDGTLDVGYPDGMKVDAVGNVWCTGPGGVHAFDPAGTLLGVVLTPEATANFCFGDDDLRTLFLCAGTVFLRIRLGQAGHPVFEPG